MLLSRANRGELSLVPFFPRRTARLLRPMRGVASPTVDDGQTPAELEAHYGPDGAVAAAYSWINTIVVAGDLRAAWAKTDLTLRLVFAQAWLWANREHPNTQAYDLDEVAESFAALGFEHDLWSNFEPIQVGELQRGWEGWERGEWGAASASRLVPPDMELVLFQWTGGEVVVYEEPTLVMATPVLLRFTPEGWLVRGLSDQAPTPGWPPEVPPPSLAAPRR